MRRRIQIVRLLAAAAATLAVMGVCASAALADAPGAPTDLAYTVPIAGSDSVNITWDAPTDLGDPAVWFYNVYASGVYIGGSSESPFMAGNLLGGVPYSITVVAMSSDGEVGPPSAPLLVTPPGLPPVYPGGVTATAGDGQATVSFQPQTDYGTPATSFTVTASPGNAQASGTASPITIGGLSNGTTYTFTVTASNAYGSSEPSYASSPVTPSDTPVATSDPTIVGTPDVGDVLAATTGDWTNDPDTFTYQWYDCDTGDPGCSAIPGATAAQYTPTPLDGGFELAVAVTASNAGGGVGVDQSAPTAVVSAPPGAPVLVSEPTLGAVDGLATVTSNPGSWTGSPSSFVYVWYVCAPDLSTCAAVAGPSSSATSYTPQSEDLGGVLVLEVVAQNAAGSSVAAFSPVSATLLAPPPTVSISAPTDGQTVLVGDPVTLSYSCSPGAGAQLAACEGPVPSGQSLDLAVGDYEIYVTAVDDDGQTTTETVDLYVVSSLPTQTGPVVTPPPAPVVLTVPTPPTPPTRPTFPLGVTGGAPGPATAPPLVAGSLAESAARWRLGRGLPALRSAGTDDGATAFTFTVSKSADVSFDFTRLAAGRLSGGRCVTATRANRGARACTRAVPAGSFTESVPSGTDAIAFSGRLNGGSALAPGRYRVAVSAEAVPSGVTVTLGTLHFTILK